jgi:uncharacterized repeat protein (TIGR03803 family)
LNNLFTFNGTDGNVPESGVVFGPDGALYGTTTYGGSGGVGVVYSLRPAATACKTALCPWTETVLYQFTGGNDGGGPSGLTCDYAGNLYGTTPGGGAFGGGTVFKLTPSNGGWTESVLYSFSGGNDGAEPDSGVILDQAGNLYGTTFAGGTGHGSGCYYQGCGTVYQLTPSGSGWKENTLYAFQGGADGYGPAGGLIFDRSGSLYGTTTNGGGGGDGTVFELSPAGGGSWTFTLLYGEVGSSASLTMDGAGSLYGTITGFWVDGDYGSVFKLTPSGGGWIYTTLHYFGGNSGENPFGGVALDANGNLYGTTSGGGAYDNGVVWEITP